VSGSKVGNAFHISSELHFKAPTKNDAERWASTLTSAPWLKGSPTVSQPASPVASRNVSAAHPPQSPATETPPPAEAETEKPNADANAAAVSPEAKTPTAETPAQEAQQEDGTVPVKHG
jgi:hypothetical protein